MNATDTGTWTDFGQLERTRADARASGEDAGARRQAALRGVARQFESVFLKMMLSSMRDASFGDPLFDSSEGDQYRDMFDHQLSLELSGQGGIGIADMLVRQLSPLVRQATGAEAAPDPFPSTADRAPILPPQAPTPLDALDSSLQAEQAASSTAPVAGVPAEATRRQVGNVVLGTLREPGPAPAAKPLSPLDEHARDFEGPEDFVARTWPHAERVADELGVEPAVLVAQAALETGWGRHVAGAGGASSNNFFGIKADRRWDGPSVTLRTLEFEGGVMRRVSAPFRAYESLAASFEDYARFVAGQPRYREALEAARGAGGDGEIYIRHLHRAGYASDPDYAAKVVDVMRRTVAAVKNADTRTL